MFVYRPHRGSLEDSIKETKYFNNIEEMKQHIFDDINGDYIGHYDKYIDIDDIVIMKDSIVDNRINWKYIKLVCIKRWGDRDFMKMYNCPQCIGSMGKVENND